MLNTANPTMSQCQTVKWTKCPKRYSPANQAPHTTTNREMPRTSVNARRESPLILCSNAFMLKKDHSSKTELASTARASARNFAFWRCIAGSGIQSLLRLLKAFVEITERLHSPCFKQLRSRSIRSDKDSGNSADVNPSRGECPGLLPGHVKGHPVIDERLRRPQTVDVSHLLSFGNPRMKCDQERPVGQTR